MNGLLEAKIQQGTSGKLSHSTKHLYTECKYGCRVTIALCKGSRGDMRHENPNWSGEQKKTPMKTFTPHLQVPVKPVSMYIFRKSSAGNGKSGVDLFFFFHFLFGELTWRQRLSEKNKPTHQHVKAAWPIVVAPVILRFSFSSTPSLSHMGILHRAKAQRELPLPQTLTVLHPRVRAQSPTLHHCAVASFPL